MLLWDVKVELRPGANVVPLNTRNATPVKQGMTRRMLVEKNEEKK